MIARIRDADAARLQRLAAVHKEAFPPPERGWSVREIGDLSRNAILVADQHDTGFALASVAADEAELLTIAVSITARRNGIGRGLLRAVLDHAAVAGAATMFLEVAEDNDTALAFYRGAGFIEAGRRKDYYLRGQRRVSAFVLSRTLP